MTNRTCGTLRVSAYEKRMSPIPLGGDKQLSHFDTSSAHKYNEMCYLVGCPVIIAVQFADLVSILG